ncbi:uncharacterized protein LOC132702831 isoform X1 [Cylas formicarius]|uniref:uncharacterized protein LOC132702831 isoform X1 n=1 Tax=Cylas formicarius TaxID=197179 RepID=UPI002958C6EA|nr:uncharacterized protein LOC132702831 isoform X1 [Cylas formicarius]
MEHKLFLIFLAIGVSYAEIDLSNPPKVNIDDLPLIKEKCEKQGKPETYGKLKEKIQETKTCIEGLIDINGIKNEIEESKKTGSMDEVFGKYCNRRPQLKECIQKSVDVAKECMEESEKQALNVTADLLEEIGNFACFHDGDRLAMFVAEGGLECLKSRSEAIQKCINDTIKIDTAAFSTFSPNSLPATIPNFTVNQEKCDDLTKLQQCVVKDLEDNCKDSTPANIIEAVFKFIKKTACKNPKQRRNNQMQSRRLVKRTIVQFAFTNSSLSTIAKLQQICQKYGSEDSVLNLMIAINKTHCKPIRFLVTPREDMIADLRSCSKPLILAMEDCLKEEAKYFPTFLMENIISVLEFGYTYANTLQKATSNRELLQCFQDIKRNKNRNLLIACFKENVQNDIFNEMNIPPKETMCGKMYSLNNCVKEVIKKVCINDVEIDTLIRDLVNALHKPCFNH